MWSASVRAFFLIYLFLSYSFNSLCNSVCTSKQWSPELDPIRLQVLQATARDKIEARNAQALELKYACYPSTRPHGWAPATQPLIDTDGENNGNALDDDDDDYYNAFGDQQQRSVPPLSQHFEEHLLQAGGGNNPSLEVLFGQSTVERLKARSNLLQEQQRRSYHQQQRRSQSVTGS